MTVSLWRLIDEVARRWLSLGFGDELGSSSGLWR
jgi:hypothetical protein